MGFIGTKRILTGMGAAALAFAMQTGGALAQQTLIVGNTGDAVEINLDVLDDLGAPPTVPELLREGSPLLSPDGSPLPLRNEASRLSPVLRSPRGGPVATPTPRPAPRAPMDRPSFTKPRVSTPRVSTPAPSAMPRVPAAPMVRETRAVPPAAPAAPTRSTTLPSPPKAVTVPVAKIPPRAKVAIAAPEPVRKVPKAPATKAEPPKTVTPASVRPPAPPRPPAASASGALASLTFSADGKDLSDQAKAKLDAIVKSLKADPEMRIQLVAYGKAGTPSASRRLSLSRALAARSHLMSKGIRSTRMDVRALGEQGDGASPDRVDITVTGR